MFGKIYMKVYTYEKQKCLYILETIRLGGHEYIFEEIVK